MSADPRVKVGVAAFLARAKNRGTEVLLLKRAEDATHGGGTWALVGGWVDYGESPQEAVARELREEANIFVLPKDGTVEAAVANSYEKEGMHVVCVFYAFDEFDDSKMKNMEPEKHETLLWLPVRDLQGLELFPPLRDFALEIGWISD
jgi:8-oxo-dGTP diphosphatase